MTVKRIRPARIHGRIRAPPSKSYTHRALLAAFFAEAPCEVVGPLDSDDTRATRNGLRVLGAQVRRSRDGWVVSPGPGGAQVPQGAIDCADSGTTLRFLAAAAAQGGNPVRFGGSRRLASRPMEELYGALRTLGARVQTPSKTRCLPCVVRGPISPGRVAIRGDVSSQFTSALLMVLPRLAGRSELRLGGTTVSRPYIDATCAVLDERGIHVRRSRIGFVTHGPQRYRSGRIRVPGDASSAAYLWAAAAATAGSVDVEGVPDDLPQADLAILPILAAMGARVRRAARFVRVAGPLVEPITVDLTDAPDLFPLVSVLAALVPGRTSRLTGAPQIAFKESDRRIESARLARALGARVIAAPSRLEIRGSLTPRRLDCPSLRDHRLVMSAAVAGLSTNGTSRIGRAEAVTKSFPGFWNALGALTEGGGLVR
ncbi:MAG: 3-phosphoshikimate 1-carboxyvinyltransferase [Thermoplasmata archaeon]|nr:3-phosphoshikimate 1-carboxyvinyltransferase [Thermoplasmata archaeon]